MLAVFDGFIRLFGFSCVLPCEFFGSALWLYISLICWRVCCLLRVICFVWVSLLRLVCF